MRVFEKKQRFKQCWLYAIFSLVIMAIGIHKDSEGFQNFDNSVTALFPMVFILLMRHDTRIDPEEIMTNFFPIGFSRRFFPWKTVDEVYVRKYSPVAEYGGWGIRGIGRKKAYNVAGNLGIQIVTKDKRVFNQHPKTGYRKSCM